MKSAQDWLVAPDGVADRLRTLRVRAALSGKDLADALGWQPSKVSRLENGRQSPSVADAEAWAAGCGADVDASNALARQVEAATVEGAAWRRRMRAGQAAVQTDYNELVDDADIVRHFETAWVPGLLQTAEYARRVFREMVEIHRLGVDDVEAAVAARLQRQQQLYDPSKRFEFLLCEPVLRWRLLPPAAMRGQLDRLQTVIGMSNVRFGILPMDVQLPVAPQNSFQMYDDLVIVETFVGETAHRGEEAALYARLLGQLWGEAVSGEDAREFIVDAARALPRASAEILPDRRR